MEVYIMKLKPLFDRAVLKMTEAEETGSTDRKDTEVDIDVFIDYDTRIKYSVYIKIT